MLKSWRPYFIIFVVGFLLFYQTLFFDLTFLDDQALLLDNFFQLNSQGVEGIFLNDAFFSSTNIYYRPLLNLTFWLEMKIDGPNYFVFHFFNIIFHIISTWLIFSVLKKVKVKEHLAFFFSLVFLVHPALTQAVAWIPGRNDSLLALFVLASFLLLLKFLEKERLSDYLGHTLFLLLALFTKETAVFTAVIFFFYLIIVKRQKIFATNSWLLYLGWAATTFIYFLMRIFALENGVVLSLKKLLVSAGENLVAFVMASGKIFFPFNLKVLPIVADSTLWYGWATFVIIILLFVFMPKKNWRLSVFGLIWFIIFLLPTLLLQDKELGVDFHLEHRIYLPMLGVFFLIIGLVDFNSVNLNRRIFKVGALGIIVGLAVLSFFHSQNFKNGITFWQSAVKNSPSSPLAHRNLGVMYYFNRNYDFAIEQYQQSLSLNEEEPMVHNNLGLIYLEQGKQLEAEREFKQELVGNPDYSKALFNLGELYNLQGKHEEAQQLWEKTLRVDPNHFQAYQRLLISPKQLR